MHTHRLRGNRDDLTALHWSNLLVVEPAICDCDGFAPFRFTGYNKMPHVGHFIIPGGDEGIRTLDTVARIHDFESRAFDHSATSPTMCDYTDSVFICK